MLNAILNCAGGFVGSAVGTSCGHAVYDCCRYLYHKKFDKADEQQLAQLERKENQIQRKEVRND